LVLHLLEADVLTVECLREEDLAAIQSKGPAVANPPDLDMRRVDRRLDAVGVGVPVCKSPLCVKARPLRHVHRNFATAIRRPQLWSARSSRPD
jgi:hypothetical protein